MRLNNANHINTKTWKVAQTINKNQTCLPKNTKIDKYALAPAVHTSEETESNLTHLANQIFANTNQTMLATGVA